jgi:hypothetical protein
MASLEYKFPFLNKSIMSKSLFILCLLVVALNLLLAGCGSSDPFSYVQVSGKLAYEDGTLIPSNEIVLTFYPQASPIDAKSYPRPGMVVVDKTGAFSRVTSHLAGDGLVRGKHKVTLTNALRQPLSSAIIPPEYADLSKTPLEVDTTVQPFELKVKKPK